MSGTIDHKEGAKFIAVINNASLPSIAATTTIPKGKTWLAHGVCKLLEARAFSTSGSTSATSTGAASTIGRFAAEGGADSGTGGGADSGTSGGTLYNCSWVPHTCSHYCAHYCARYCAHYCARYCGTVSYTHLTLPTKLLV